jgi:hypothetical protein
MDRFSNGVLQCRIWQKRPGSESASPATAFGEEFNENVYGGEIAEFNVPPLQLHFNRIDIAWDLAYSFMSLIQWVFPSNSYQ